MPKRVSLMGWPGSGKTLFTIGIAHALDNLNEGYLEPRPREYGAVLASAMSGKPVKVSPTREDHTSQIRLRSGARVEVVERCFSRRELGVPHPEVADAVIDSNGLLFFIRPEFERRGSKSSKGPVGGRPAVAIQVSPLGSLFEQVFGPFKFRRKTRFVMFIMTRTNPKEFSPRYLEKCITSEIGGGLALLRKRGVRCTYHPLELIYPKMGINRKGLTYTVRTLLENIR